MINSTDTIEDSGFPGSIRSDDGINGSSLHCKANLIQGSNAPKRDGQIFYFENWVHNFEKNSIGVGETLTSPYHKKSNYNYSQLIDAMRHALCAMRFTDNLLRDPYPICEPLNVPIRFDLSIKYMFDSLSLGGTKIDGGTDTFKIFYSLKGLYKSLIV